MGAQNNVVYLYRCGYLQLYFADNDVKKRYNNINNAVVIYDIDKYYF